MKIMCEIFLIVMVLLVCFGCASAPLPPYYYNDSGRMGVQMSRNAKPVRSEFELLVETRTLSACVHISSVGVIESCREN